jgi:hypothetical protein
MSRVFPKVTNSIIFRKYVFIPCPKYSIRSPSAPSESMCCIYPMSSRVFPKIPSALRKYVLIECPEYFLKSPSAHLESTYLLRSLYLDLWSVCLSRNGPCSEYFLRSERAPSERSLFLVHIFTWASQVCSHTFSHNLGITSTECHCPCYLQYYGSQCKPPKSTVFLYIPVY